jgi:hypothetical protein
MMAHQIKKYYTLRLLVIKIESLYERPWKMSQRFILFFIGLDKHKK